MIFERSIGPPQPENGEDEEAVVVEMMEDGEKSFEDFGVGRNHILI